MAQLQPTKEGTVPFRVPSIDKECFTFYKIFGDLSAGKPALVLMHGGPGAGHEYLLPFAELWPRYGIPVVFYDMIGCASSTHLPETKGDKNFWKPPLFFAELDNLLDQLKLRDYGFHLLGHSFGGMIGSEYASRRPQGLRKLVLASGLASKELSLKGFSTRKKQLPLEVQRVFDEGEKNKDFSSDEYKAAKMVFRKNFACRTDPMPTEMLAAIKNLSSDNTVHETMYGPSMMNNTGSMIGWTAIPHLHKIEAPTLIYHGEYDTSIDAAQVPFFELIPRVRWKTFSGAAHMCHLEASVREQVLKLVGDFLLQEPTAQ